jgi:hypothetical protein
MVVGCLAKVSTLKIQQIYCFISLAKQQVSFMVNCTVRHRVLSLTIQTLGTCDNRGDNFHVEIH